MCKASLDFFEANIRCHGTISRRWDRGFRLRITTRSFSSPLTSHRALLLPVSFIKRYLSYVAGSREILYRVELPYMEELTLVYLEQEDDKNNDECSKWCIIHEKRVIVCEKTGVNNRYQFRSLTNKLSKRDFDRRANLLLIATIVSCFLFYFSMFFSLIFVPFSLFFNFHHSLPTSTDQTPKTLRAIGTVATCFVSVHFFCRFWFLCNTNYPCVDFQWKSQKPYVEHEKARRFSKISNHTFIF